MKLRIALAAATAAAASAATAAPVTGNTTAEVTILSPNTVVAMRDLQFGAISKPLSGSSTVTIASTPAASQTPVVTGGGTVPVAGQGRAAIFRLTGTNGQTYSVGSTSLSFTGQAGNLTNVGAESPTSQNTLGTLPASGIDDLAVGGHFDISNTTAMQAYSGTLSLTINFN